MSVQHTDVASYSLGLLQDDAKQPGSHHDFGMDILPKLADKAPSMLTISRPTASPASRKTPCLTGAMSEPSRPITKPIWI